MFSFHMMGAYQWSVKNEDGQWWCGSRHGWVHETSSHWATVPDCYNELFDSFEDARSAVTPTYYPMCEGCGVRADDVRGTAWSDHDWCDECNNGKRR